MQTQLTQPATDLDALDATMSSSAPQSEKQPPGSTSAIAQSLRLNFALSENLHLYPGVAVLFDATPIQAA